MKGFKTLFIIVIGIIIAVFVISNIYLQASSDENDSRPYRVEANRILHQIEKSGYESVNLSDYSYITNIEMLTDKNKNGFFSGAESDYLIIQAENQTYRLDYSYKHKDKNNTISAMNISLAVMACAVIGTLLFVEYKIIKPFNILKNVPFELSRGVLTVPLKENKNRYFGHFIWGMDLLRERLEQQKNEELKLQKEKKTLILSVSHDIKTPLGIIELYAKALEKNLYKNEKTQNEIAAKILIQCDEIQKYIKKIVKMSSEDFLNLEVNNGEFYISEAINYISNFYKEKLNFLKIDFSVGDYSNCIIKGDIDRSVEVLQNIIENAIKYGDGKHIKISFSQEENCILITVANSGCTLSENELPHIFESFWRGSNTGSKNGSGLGLYICHQLMKKMDGDIFAECNNGFMYITAVFRMA